MTRALALAEPESYVHTFADEGAVMGELLSAALEARRRAPPEAANVSTHYLAKLLAALSPEAGIPDAAGQLPEPLSERELEVLGLIAAGESNTQLAGRLFISASTVKTHINNLYRKLGAHSRTRAVARARSL
jgi:LuxR family maltose regulon positive regulatory protein